jgi:acetoin utilization deacetylase AcuC-like enzyme
LAVEDAMDRARVYFHPSFRERPRLAWLPGSLGEVSTLLEVDEVPGREPLLRVHAPSLVERVERSRLRALALRSSAVVVAAARDVQAQGGTAVALPALGGHHAGRAFYGGMCLLNDVALALSDLRARGPWRAAVVDTDAHHADGTLDLLGADASTMYLCVCTEGFPPPHPEKFDVRVGPGMSAEAYLEATLAAFAPRARRFRPDMLVWYLGYDLLEGEYASLGFGTDLLLRLGQALAGLAGEVAQGRIMVVLGGGKDPVRAEAAVRAAILGLSSPGTMPVLPAPEPVERDVLPRPRPASREWVEMTFGPLGSGRQEVNIGEETLTGRDVLLRMGIWGEDIDPIDIVTIEEGGRWALRCFDGEDRRVAVLEFSPRLDILSETRVHIREWMGDDYYAFDWPAGCPWPL